MNWVTSIKNVRYSIILFLKKMLFSKLCEIEINPFHIDTFIFDVDKISKRKRYDAQNTKRLLPIYHKVCKSINMSQQVLSKGFKEQ